MARRESIVHETVIQRGDWTWRVRPDLAGRITDLERAVLTIARRRDAQKVKSTDGRRAIWLAPLPEAGINRAFIKHYSAPRFVKQLKHVVRNSRTRQEWEMGVRFEELGLPAARHLAMAERRDGGLLKEDFLVQEALEGYINYDRWFCETVEAPGLGARERGEEVKRLARLIRRMHDLGVLQRDFKPDSIMVGPDRDLRFVDLERALVRPGKGLALPVRLDNLAKIDQTFGFVGSGADRMRFLETYFGGEVPAEQVLEYGREISLGAEGKFRKRVLERRGWTEASNEMYRVFEQGRWRVATHRALPREFFRDLIARIEAGEVMVGLPYPAECEAGLTLTGSWCDARTALGHTPGLYYRRIPFVPARAALYPGPGPYGLLLTVAPAAPVMTWREGRERSGDPIDYARRLGAFWRVLHRMGLTWRGLADDTILYEADRGGGPAFYVNRLDRLLLDYDPDDEGKHDLAATAARLELTGAQERALREGYRECRRRWFRAPDRW